MSHPAWQKKLLCGDTSKCLETEVTRRFPYVA